MNIDFSTIDKSDFKCLKSADGSIYFGQMIQAYFGDAPPKNPNGFAVNEVLKKHSEARLLKIQES